MKLSNYFVLFLLLTTITSSRVQAQLAGGTYTIGPFGNFTTLNDAVNALSAGITGPVVFDVDASVVYDESIVIEAIAGSSAVNTVTFRGNGATIARTTQPSSNPLLNASTIFLYGSSYVTIDSFNIVPQAGSSTDGVRLGANAHHNTITNCTIDLSNTSSAYYASGGIYSVGYILGIPFYFLNSPMSLASHCTITNNRIINTNDDVLAYGVNLSGLIGNSGSNTNRIENNSVEGYYYAGISLVAGQDNSVVQGNTIDGRFQIGIHLISTGISISVQNNVVRTDNSILESSNGNIEVYGLLLEDGQGLTGFATQVKNNLIVLESGFFPVTGLATETNNVLFYNNTVHIRTNDVADAIGIHVNRGFSSLPMDNTEVVNNIVSIDGRGQGDKYLFHLANDFWVSSDYGWYDYNSYYFTNQTNNGFFGYSYYTQYSTLADWQAAFGGAYEQNGVYSNPVFTSPATFDFTPNSPVLDNRGFDLISTGTVIKDFNYQTRIPPMDPGALIFTALDENATISELELPTSVSVPGNSDVRVTIQNSGINVLTSAEIKWRVDGGAVQTNSWAGSLVTSAEESNIVLGNLNFSAGTHTFQLWLEDLNGIVGTNSKDTLIEEVVFCNTLSGVYSIGGGAADFPSILDAVESLKSCGVAGPVTFNVDAGIYTGEVVIPEISGASSVNTITFNGNGSIITDFPVYGKRYVVYVKGKHITFRDFTIQSSNPEYGWLYRLGEGAAYNVIDRCTLDASFQTDPVYDGSIGVLSSGSETSAGNVGLPAAYNHHNTVSNNFFKGASTASMSIGVQFMRGDSNTIVGNHFADIEDEGIYSSHSTGGNTISGNTFSYEDRAINDHVVAIRLSQSGGGNIIENNKVDFRDQYFESYTGISIVSSSTGSMNPDIIRNNIIHFRGSARIGKGIEIRRSDFAYILNNTIVAEPDDLETKLSLIYVYGSPSTPNNRVENNLLYLNAEGISPKYFIELRDKADITDYGSFDFNNFFATSNSQNVNVADHHGTTYPSLSDWQLAGGNFDQNSTEFNPNIFFPVDGQYRPTNAQMDNLGKDLLTPGLVVSDFDGSARTIEPDQGALEFIPTSIDIGMTELDVPATPIIPGLHNIEVSFKNYGTNVITSAEIYWQINGGAINTKSFVGALNSRQEENNFFLSSHNFGAGLSEIRVWSSDPNGLADEVPVNDTIIKNINVCNPLNGLYTIGGISPDFPDLNSAVSKLENCGISGPVVFDVAAGSVFNEKVVIHEIFGTSSINTVTFNGNGSTIEYDAQEGDREILFLKGASYLTLDNFVIKSTNPDYYWGLRLGYGAGHNTISNCVFDGTNLSTAYNSTGAIVSSNSDYMTTFGVNAETHDNIIEDNTILGKKILSNVTLQYGIFIRGTAAGAGSASNIIRRNTITNTSGPGIFLTYCEGNQIIAENELRNGEIRVDNGISIYDSGPGILVERNLIVNNSATQSIIRFIRCQGTKTNPHVVRNNILYNKTSSNADAFYISSTNHVHLLNNTLVFDESGSYERGFLLISSDSCVILNNLLSINYKDGYKSSVYSISQTQTESNWDYNNFYVSSSNINPLEFANYLGTIYSTLADWKLAVGGSFDQSSVDYNPFFVDVEAENFTPQNGQLNDLGFDLFTSGQVTEDFFGNPRSAFMDIGAIEFDKSLLDIGVSAIIAPSDGQATGLSAIEVEIENFGIQNVTSTEISFEIDGGAPTTYNWAGSLATGDVTSVVIGNYNFSKGSHVIKAWTENPNASNDDVKANDTIERNVIFCKSYSGIYTVGGVTSDFATFNEAFATLSKCGITGPITLDVQAGESFDERFTIPYIPGSSNINTLLVKGNGARLSPTILNEKSIVTLDSTKYVTIEDLNISVGNTFYDRSLWGFFLTNKAENITIRACSLLIDPNYLWNSFDEFVGVVVSGGLESKTLPTDVSNVLIEGCHFFAPRATSQLGISVEGLAAGNGSSNFTVRDNLIENCRLAGISFHNTSGFHTITNNEIRNTNMNDPEDFLGIKFDYAGVGSIIERNYIHSPRADRQWSLEYSTGIEIRYSAGSPGNENIVRNNIIDFSSLGDWTTGIYLYRSDYISILNNTIIINELTGDHLRFGIRAYSHTNPENELTNCEILNNLIYINDAGSPDKYLINLIGTDQGYYDYNNYFITPQSFNTNVGRSSIDYPTLVDWQTADGASYDQNSFDLDPTLLQTHF
jgi:parallel beta-helix repeat protein